MAIQIIHPNTLPRWQCHKVVQAGKITGMTQINDGMRAVGSWYLELGELGRVYVNVNYMTKHGPEVGGWYVLYADGYQSFSPASAFSSGYTRLKDEARP